MHVSFLSSSCFVKGAHQLASFVALRLDAPQLLLTLVLQIAVRAFRVRIVRLGGGSLEGNRVSLSLVRLERAGTH